MSDASRRRVAPPTAASCRHAGGHKGGPGVTTPPIGRGNRPGEGWCAELSRQAVFCCTVDHLEAAVVPACLDSLL